MNTHYVIYSVYRGVYLSGWWSTDNHGMGQDWAPTWQKGVAVKILTMLIDRVPDAELREVFPDRENFGASEDACARAGLPRWDHKAYKKETDDVVSSIVR